MWGAVLAHGSLNSEEERKHIVLGQRCISEGHKQIRHVEMRPAAGLHEDSLGSKTAYKAHNNTKVTIIIVAHTL